MSVFRKKTNKEVIMETKRYCVTFVLCTIIVL